MQPRGWGRKSRWLPLIALASCLGLVACYEGRSGADAGAADDSADPDGGGGGPPDALCGGEPGPSPIRRLTRTEYSNTVRDLLGDESAPGSDFIGESVIGGFDNNALGAPINRTASEQLESAAKTLAETAVEDLDGLLQCEAGQEDDACVRAFIAGFGARAFRRPLTADEEQGLFDFYAGHRDSEDLATSVRLLLTAMLQSPYFLYRVEYGQPTAPTDTVVALSSYEMASRLSYLLWNSMPDAALFEAAAADEIRTSEQIAAQVDRMLGDPKARASLVDFHEQWLSLRGSLPGGVAQIEPLLREETRTFIERVILAEDGRLDTLLRADFSYMNRQLAEFYGLDAAALGDAFDKVALDPDRRSGLLTQATVMGVFAEEDQSSPIARGRFVREQLMCQELPPPPPGVMVDPPELDPTKTTRERFAQHREDPACAGCHVLLDPVGFGFEHYDQFGQWRDEENGFPVDASGEVSGARDPALEGPFDGAVELADRLAASSDVRDCVVENWFRYAYGRVQDEQADECTNEHLVEVFATSDGSVRELLVALTQTDAFRFRLAQGGQ